MRCTAFTTKMLCTAFQVTEDDVEQVLEEHSPYVIDGQGKSLAIMAAELIDKIDNGRISKVALNAGCDLDEQTQGAHDEIKKILVELGVLEF